MRISDWSSDVCSSDLRASQARCRAGATAISLSAPGGRRPATWFNAVAVALRPHRRWCGHGRDYRVVTQSRVESRQRDTKAELAGGHTPFGQRAGNRLHARSVAIPRHDRPFSTLSRTRHPNTTLTVKEGAVRV